MKVYKFGGASVKDANGVRNLIYTLQKVGYEDTLIVISAMGKMTNAFEDIVNSYIKQTHLTGKVNFVKEYHNNILNELFSDNSHPIFNEIETIWAELSNFFINNNNQDYNYIYDQVVSIAEKTSTTIISAFLNENKISNKWLDAKEYIKTDNTYREAIVDWETTEKNITELINEKKLLVTQGFIASDNNNNTTTLGREGSDYSAAIFAYCLSAESMTIFKDVAGVLNADPKLYTETSLLEEISYREAIEMAFFGASVIHPKTLQPIQEKSISLYVKSFINPLEKGTIIKKGIDLKPITSCYIVKDEQILISISTRDFSFVMEDNLSEIFDIIHRYKLQVNLIQNTAISFTVCMEDKFNNFKLFLNKIKLKYKVNYSQNLTLLTVRHFDTKTVEKIKRENKVLLLQTSRETAQFVVETIKK